jgi:hypothetical protein
MRSLDVMELSQVEGGCDVPAPEPVCPTPEPVVCEPPAPVVCEPPPAPACPPISCGIIVTCFSWCTTFFHHRHHHHHWC